MTRIRMGSRMSHGWVFEGVQWIYRVDLVDPCVGVVGVASCSEEGGLRGSCGLQELVELALVWIHSDLVVCSAGGKVEEGKMKGMDEENVMVRRVLNGPCASGRGGQVISEEISHGLKA